MCIYNDLMRNTYTRDKDGKLVAKPKISAPRYTGYKHGDEVQIAFGITKCQFLTPYPRALEEALTVHHPGYMFVWSFKSGQWDGKHHFITRPGYFPTGLLPVIIHILKTGNNPLIDDDKKSHKVLTKPVKSIAVIPTKEAEKFYYKGFEDHFELHGNLMDNFNPEQGTFTYSQEILKTWSTQRNQNSLAPKVLQLAKTLHESFRE